MYRHLLSIRDLVLNVCSAHARSANQPDELDIAGDRPDAGHFPLETRGAQLQALGVDAKPKFRWAIQQKTLLPYPIIEKNSRTQGKPEHQVELNWYSSAVSTIIPPGSAAAMEGDKMNGVKKEDGLVEAGMEAMFSRLYETKQLGKSDKAR